MSGAATGYARMQGAICKTMMWSTLSALSKKTEKESRVWVDHRILPNPGRRIVNRVKLRLVSLGAR